MDILIYLSAHLEIAAICSVLLGLIIGLSIVFIWKRKASAFVVKNPDAVVMTIFKKKTADNNWADNLIIKSVNGEKPIKFLLRPVRPAIYLLPGKNRVVAVAKWARGQNGFIKMFSTSEKELQVVAEKGRQYSLEYCISAERFVFEEYDKQYLQFLMRDISWVFITPAYLTQKDFFQSLKEYNEKVSKKSFQDKTIESIGNEIIVYYEYWDEDKEDTVEDELQIRADGTIFTEVELLYKIHNSVCEKLQNEDNHFFEGLQLYASKNENPPAIPYYYLIQGS